LETARLIEMAVRSIETTETAMEIDGDGSGGTSPSRQGAGTETSVPRNSSAAAAELRNCSGNFTDSFRVFRPEASYRRRGIIRGQPGTPMCEGGLWPPSGSLSVFRKLPGNTKTAKNRELALWHRVNRLVPEIA
jgi:hypothetical protein